MKALYWIISSAVTIAGMSMMGVGADVMHRESKNNINSIDTYQEVSSINVNVQHTDVQISTSDKAEGCTVELKNVPKTVEVSAEGGTLRIKDRQMALHFFDFSILYDEKSEIILTVPEERFKEVKIDCTSSSSTVNGVCADAIEIDVGAGNLDLTDVQCGTCKLDDGSGNIRVDSVQVDGRAVVDVGSGNLDLTGMRCGTFKLDDGSGNIKVDGVQIDGTAVAYVGSGNVRGSGLTVGDVLDISIGSGAFEINDCSFAGATNCDLGSGNLRLTDLVLTNDLGILCGSGFTQLALVGDREDYAVNFEGGSGSAMIDGVRTNFKTGSPYTIKIHSGSGNADVSFTEREE